MSTPQNIYDDPDFYAGYARLRETGTGLNDVLEQPALRRLLPKTLSGLRILDLGCGFGDFARFARDQGAGSVLGIDVSDKMIDAACARTHDDAINYQKTSIEDFDPADHTAFDLVVSSLALHYVADYQSAIGKIARTLSPGGSFVFSVEHPICTARAEQNWVRDGSGKPLYWPVDQYRDEGPRDTNWFVQGVIKYHRTVETYVNGILDAGLILTGLLEPEPIENADEEKWGDHRRRPPFLILSAKHADK